MSNNPSRLLFSLALTAVIATLAYTAVHLQASDNTLKLLRVRVTNQTEINQLTDLYDIWEVDAETRTVLIGGNEAIQQALETAGWQVTEESNTVIPSAVETLRTFYSGYRTVPELYADLQTISNTYPSLVELVDYGDSHCLTNGGCTTGGGEIIDGYDLYALRLSNEAISGTSTISGSLVISGSKPVLMLSATTHAREITTPEVAMRFIDWLLAGYGTDADRTWLLDYHEIWVVPMLNPDGHHIVWLGTQPPYNGSPFLQRKNGNNTGCSQWTPTSGSHTGVDLNRNHSSLEWGTTGVSNSPCSALYGGTAAGSEAETQHIETLTKALIPDQRGTAVTDAAPDDTTGIYITLHSYGDYVLWSWGNSYDQATANDTELEMIGEKLATYNGYRACQPGVDSFCLGAVSGASEDWVYETLGIPAYTFELGDEFLAPYSDIDSNQWPENRDSFLYAAKIADAPYQRIHGPDVANVVTSANLFTLTITADLDESDTGGQAVAGGRFSIGAPLNHSPIISGVLDLPDLTPDSVTDSVQITIDASTVTTGTYPLFVYGVDELGNEGPPTAVWLTLPGDIIPPTESIDIYLPYLSR